MKVRLFATLREIAGTREVEMTVGAGQTAGDVLHALVQRYPNLHESIWYADGTLAGHVAVILNGRDLRHLAGVNTPLSGDDQLDVFPPVGGGAAGDDLTHVTLKFTSFFRARVGLSETEFAFKGTTLREFVQAVLQQYDIADLLVAGDELKPHVRVVIDGRFSYLLGGWEAQIPEGAMVVVLHSYVVAF